MAPHISKKARKRQIIHVKVGPKKIDFGISKSLICQYSPYFHAAFHSGFRETKTGVLKLPHTEVEVFSLFYHWLHTGILFDPKSPTEEWPAADDILKLYVFADMVDILCLRNQCIDTAYELIGITGYIPTNMIGYLWENTLEESPVRRFMLDLVVWELGNEAFLRNPESFPEGVRLEIMERMARLISRLRDSEVEVVSPLKEMANYHERVHRKLVESRHRTEWCRPDSGNKERKRKEFEDGGSDVSVGTWNGGRSRTQTRSRSRSRSATRSSPEYVDLQMSIDAKTSP